ncbi:MAG: hypothetical protein U0L85_01185 [Bacilli bacterium]|nr:hypothetical protein [Bacilli bacterium]
MIDKIIGYLVLEENEVLNELLEMIITYFNKDYLDKWVFSKGEHFLFTTFTLKI